MRKIPGSLRFLCVLVLAVGCGPAPIAVDSAVEPVDAAVPTDAAPTADAPDVDAVAVDTGPVADVGPVDGGDPCDLCTGESACLRGVCITTCGADIGAIDSALSAELVPVASYCRTPSAFSFAGGRVYEVSASRVDLVTTFSLARWTPGPSGVPTVEALGITTYTASTATELLFTGGFVAVNGDESQVVFGYTTTLAGSLGGVFDIATSSGVAIETSSPGNFDATFVDATHYLVDGLGLGVTGAQGLYRGVGGSMGGALVVDHVGQYSGSLALWADEGLVLAGGGTFTEAWPDGEMGDRVLVLAAADLASAISPIDGSAVQHIDMPSAFRLIAGPRLASAHYDASFNQDGIETRAISRTGTGPVVVGAPVSLTTGATFTSVGDAGDQIILAHASGLLFVR